MALDYEKAKVSYKCMDPTCGLVIPTFESVQTGYVTDPIQSIQPEWCPRCCGTGFQIVKESA